MKKSAMTDEAVELLETLEQQHRHDLTLHLYSSYLLKQLLRNANRGKRRLKTEVFIKTMIKDNWTSWPSPNTVLDPHVDRIYEDEELVEIKGIDINGANEADGIGQVVKKGDVSLDGLERATRMLCIELNSIWQRRLSKSGSSLKKYGDPNIALDIDKMSISTDVVNNVVMRLDSLFERLNTNFARQTKMSIATQRSSSKLIFDAGLCNKAAAGKGVSKMNGRQTSEVGRKIKLDYRDIIVCCCEMELNMLKPYIKCLELFKDIPSQYDSKQFKISKRILEKYMPDENSLKIKKLSRKLQKDYWELDSLSKDRNMDVEVRKAFRLIKLNNEFSRDKKTFMMVQEYGSGSSRLLETSRDEENHENSNMNSNELNNVEDEITKLNKDTYSLDDCLIR